MIRAPSLRLLLGSVLLGAVCELAVVAWNLSDPPRIDGWQERMAVRGGTDLWVGGERSTAAVRWINLETVGPLVAAAASELDDVPWWMPLPQGVGAMHVRSAAVGVGWPFRAVGMRWVADRSDLGFPPPAEKESSGDAPKEALRRLRDSLLGGGPAMPTDRSGAVWLDWGAAFADAALLGVPWYALGEFWRARRRPVTPRE